MPSPKANRRSMEEKNRNRRPKSFHGQIAGIAAAELQGRPRTVPDLLSGQRSTEARVPMITNKLTKLLVNVTIQRCLGAVQVLISSESTVGDLIAAALRQYEREGRRAALPSTSSADFELHYSQFSLESLDNSDPVMRLGSRNFFLCMKRSSETTSYAAPGCSTEVDRVTTIGMPWLKFMDILL